VRLGLLALLVAVSCGSAGTAQAQAAPPSAVRLNAYSAYERQTIVDALASLRATEDRAPEGKTLEDIDVLTLEVFERRDLVLPGVLTFFNVFHATTRRYVIEREILIRRGRPYRQALVDDTVRNLRTLPQLSLVLALTTQGSTADKVRLVVITKDVWSLRPNWNLQLTSGGLQSLSAQPAETNLAGTHQVVNGNFILQPNSLILGAGYTNPRLQGTRLLLVPSANIILNLPTGKPEGSYGQLVVGQPLYSPLVEWAWDAEAAWTDSIVRRYVNASLSSFNDPATGKSIPFAYRTSQFDTQYTLTRSYGWATKHDVTLGASVSAVSYPSTPQELRNALPSGMYDLQTAKDFIANEVPNGDNRVGPFVQYHTYSKTYGRLLDFDTLGLQEDFRLGHDVFLNVYPVLKAFGSSRDFVGFDAAAAYTFRMGDALARFAIESIAEVQTVSACPTRPGVPAPSSTSGPVCDSSIEPAVHLVSPTALIGRFVFDAHLLYRFTNYLNQVEYLGGDTRLRGYPASYFTGYDIMDSNLEFRTRSVDILSAQVGFVGFYDVGDAFNTWGAGPQSFCRAVGNTKSASPPSNFCPAQSLGVGLRILFPQLDRTVFRGDIGFPLGEGRAAPFEGSHNGADRLPPVSFFITLGQAFTTPTIAPGAGTGSTVSGPGLSGSPSPAISPPP
jgi:hypothetical protein